MLAIWPVVSLLLFMRMPAPKALLWSVIGGYMLLPSATRFNLPGLPDLDKASMIAIGAGLGTLIFGQRQGRPGGSLLFYGLGALFVLSPFATAYLNPDPIVGNKLFFPGMTWYDGLSLAGANLFALVPFWAGRRLLANEAGHRHVIEVLVLAMLAYSLLILVEIRLSPQLHRWVYGFFPHSFGQQMRGGGFRAVVFMSHGLVVALFLALSLVASSAAAKARLRLKGVSYVAWTGYLAVVLLLQKSLGAALLALLFAAVILLSRPRRQLTVAALVCAVVCLFPAVRGSGLIPYEAIQGLAGGFSSDRAGSLQVRLDNEQSLLAKAAARPLFGWGSWGRNRVYDLEAGRDISITDGTWIIQVGSYGWVGYIAMFGLLGLPALYLRRTYRRGADVPWASAAVGLLLALNLCDLVPNSSLTPLTWLLAGSLLVGRGGARPVVASGNAIPLPEGFSTTVAGGSGASALTT